VLDVYGATRINDGRAELFLEHSTHTHTYTPAIGIVWGPISVFLQLYSVSPFIWIKTIETNNVEKLTPSKSSM